MAMYLGKCPVYVIMIIGRFQATPSYDTFANKLWNSVTMSQKECSSSKTSATFQTLNIKSPQMTHTYAMIRTTPSQGEMLVVIHHNEHGSHHSHNSVNPWNWLKLNRKISQTEHQAQPTEKPT
jgi:hypothetical protein